MPGFNGSGPLGKGSGTGRVRGYCDFTGKENLFEPRIYCGRGMGMKNGRGIGAGRVFNSDIPNYSRRFHQYYQQPKTQSSADELSMLKQQANVIKNSLNAISERITELEKA